MNGEAGGTERNCLIESARIARGKVAPLADLKASDFAAVVFPGGFGAAKNLRDGLIRWPHAYHIVPLISLCSIKYNNNNECPNEFTLEIWFH